MEANMWVSGFCTYATIHNIFQENYILAIAAGFFALLNLGWFYFLNHQIPAHINQGEESAND